MISGFGLVGTFRIVVIGGPCAHDIGIVGRSRDGDRPRAPGINVAQGECKLLKSIRSEVVLVEEDVVVSGT